MKILVVLGLFLASQVALAKGLSPQTKRFLSSGVEGTTFGFSDKWREIVNRMNDGLFKETPESKVVGSGDSILYSRTVDAELRHWLRRGKITAKEVDIFRDQAPFYVKNWKEYLVPKDLVQARKAMEEAGIPMSFETFEKLRKNAEDGSVFLPDDQVLAFSTLGEDVLTGKNEKLLRMFLREDLLYAHHKGFEKIYDHYSKFTDRASELAEKDNHHKELFYPPLYRSLAFRQLVEEGVLTGEIAKKVETHYWGDWLPVTEVFK